MAIYLTNGKFYIRHNQTGAVTKTANISEAQNFHTVEKAIRQKEKAPEKCAGYYYIAVDDVGIKEQPVQEKKIEKCKRKSFTARDRQRIYRKTKGHCYLCGEFIDFDSFEIEHRIPLAKGGTNELSNLYCACHCCNTIKHDIYPREFMEKISQIYLYQTEKRLGGSFKWKIIKTLLA